MSQSQTFVGVQGTLAQAVSLLTDMFAEAEGAGGADLYLAMIGPIKLFDIYALPRRLKERRLAKIAWRWRRRA
jgi:hypothetical protein